jgi:hypothetical protein
MSTGHDFFNPRSAFGKLRAAIRTQDKLRGYFLHLHSRQAKKAAASPPPETIRLPIEPNVLPWPQQYALAAAEAGERFVLSLSRPERTDLARVTATIVPGSAETPSRLVVQLKFADPQERPRSAVACRVLLLEPELLENLFRLEPALRPAKGERLASTLGKLFQEPIWSRFEVRQLLSAVPEIDGEVPAPENGNSPVKLYAPLPARCADITDLPAHVHVVAVIE